MKGTINEKFKNAYKNVGYKKEAFSFEVRQHIVAYMEYTGASFEEATKGAELGQDGLHIDMYSMKHVAAICYVERSLEDEISSLAELNDFEDEPEKKGNIQKGDCGPWHKRNEFWRVRLSL